MSELQADGLVWDDAGGGHDVPDLSDAVVVVDVLAAFEDYVLVGGCEYRVRRSTLLVRR